MSEQRLFNALPPAVIALAVIIFGVEAMFNLAERGLLGGPGGVAWRIGAIENWGFFGQALDWMIASNQYPPQLLARFFSYPLLHLSFTHALFACVFILAIGKMVGEAFGNLAVLVLFFIPAAFGALVYGLVLNDPQPLVGGFPGVYGLIGGYTFLLWLRASSLGEHQLTAFRLIGVLLAIQLLFGLVFGLSNDWVADLAGFVAGFLLSFPFVPGATALLMEKLRRR
ncbi:MAG: rhomboid family intramembrane serine protease [Pseudomonadota bacterium]